MISFVRGPGGVVRRFLAEGAPFAVALVAAAWALALAPVGAAVATLLVVWVATSAVLRAVRRRPRLRRLWRLALAAHVVFWSALGLAQTAPEAAGPIQPGGSSVWRAADDLLAGHASAAFALPDHATLAGWGGRPRRRTLPAFAGIGLWGRLSRTLMASRSDDGGARVPLFRRGEGVSGPGPLGARALVLRPADPRTGPPLALVRLDLVTTDAALTAAIHRDTADLGFRPETIVVAATHTHSGPGGYSPRHFAAVAGTDHYDAASFEAIRAAAVRAVRAAHAAARPARLGRVEAFDRARDGSPGVARLRGSGTGGALDDRVMGLRVEAVDDDRPLAVLLAYPVHPTVLRRRHMRFDRDLAGAFEEALAGRLRDHPPVLYVNGAVADVAPRGDDEEGDSRARALAAAFVDAVAPAFETASTPLRRARLAAVRVQRGLGTPRIVVTRGDRARVLAEATGPAWTGDAGRLAANLVALPVNVAIWSVALPDLHVGFTWDGSFGAVVNLEDWVGGDRYACGALVLAPAPGDATAQPLAIVWQPGEATQALAAAWRADFAALGYPDVLHVGLAGDACAYLGTEAEYAERSYESRATLHGGQAGARMGEALVEALRAASRALDATR